MPISSSLGQSLGSALGQFAFGGDTRKSDLKGMLDGAKAGAYDANRTQSLAQALKAQAEADQLKAQSESRQPAAVLRNAMTNFGIPENELPAIEQFMKTGRLGGGYDVAADGMGPVMPPPSWSGKLPDVGRTVSGINNALTVGDKSVETIAKAASLARGDRMKDDVMGGRLDATKLAQAEYAGKGSAPFNFNEYGVGNNLTGKLDDSTGPAVNFANKRQAETKAQIANAAQSYASAGNSNASASKTRQEIEQGGKSGQTQIVTDANGNVTLVNKVTGLARPAMYADGQTVGAKVGPLKGDKPLTEGQAKAVAFASRMENSNSIIEQLAKSGTNTSVPGSRSGFGLGGVINAAQPEGNQQLDQAKRDFINATLRRESGAVISDAEFDNAEKQYFPQILEGKKVLAQKATNRRIALEGMKADIPASMGDATGNVIRKAGGDAPPAAAPKDGAVSKSKSGKPMVMRNGQWEYQ